MENFPQFILMMDCCMSFVFTAVKSYSERFMDTVYRLLSIEKYDFFILDDSSTGALLFRRTRGYPAQSDFSIIYSQNYPQGAVECMGLLH